MYTIYTKDQCGYCLMLKEMLSANGIEYIEININNDIAAKTYIVNEGHKTVPQIYKDGKLFVEGGFAGMQNYLSLKEIEERKTWHTTDLGSL